MLYGMCVGCLSASCGYTPWENLQYTFGVTGTHTLSFAMRNVGDGNFPSALAVANLVVCVTDTPGTCLGRSSALYCARNEWENAMRNELASNGVQMSTCSGSFFDCIDPGTGVLVPSAVLSTSPGTGCLPGLHGGPGTIVSAASCGAGVFTGGAVAPSTSAAPTPTATSSPVSITATPSTTAASTPTSSGTPPVTPSSSSTGPFVPAGGSAGFTPFPSGTASPSATPPTPSLTPSYTATATQTQTNIPTPPVTSSPYYATLACPHDGLICDGVCANSFHWCIKSVATPSQSTAMGTLCTEVANSTVFYVGYPADLGCAVASPSPAAATSTPAPSHGTGCSSSGILCAESADEVALRAAYYLSGVPVSPCTASFVQCWNGPNATAQAVAPGTACLNNEIIYQNAPTCAGAWAGPVPGSPTASPSPGTLSPTPSYVAPSPGTAACPVDGIVCDSVCGTTFYICQGGVAYGSQATPPGTVCSNAPGGGAAVFASFASLNCPSVPATPLPSPSSTAVVSALPSSVADGYYCAASAAEISTRATLQSLGYAPSPCYLSFYRVYGGVSGPLQPVADGTACLGNGQFVLQTRATCGIMSLAVTHSPSPSPGYTASRTGTNLPTPSFAVPSGVVYCVTNGPNAYGPPCYSYYQSNGMPPMPLAAGVACYVPDATLPDANATLTLVNVYTDPRCAGSLPSSSASASLPSTLTMTPSNPPTPSYTPSSSRTPSHTPSAPATPSITPSPSTSPPPPSMTPSNLPTPSAAATHFPSGSCAYDGLFCTTQCGDTLYMCSAGVRYAPFPHVLGTLCYDPAANVGSGGSAMLVATSDTHCVAPNSRCAGTGAVAAVCYSAATSGPAPYGTCTDEYYICTSGQPSPLSVVPAGTLCLDGSLVYATNPACASNGSGPSPSALPTGGATVRFVITVGGLVSSGLDPATVAAICAIFANLLSNGTVYISSRDVVVVGVAPIGASPSPTASVSSSFTSTAIASATTGRLRALRAAVVAFVRRLDLLPSSPIVAYVPRTTPLPGVPVFSSPPLLGFGGLAVTIEVVLRDASQAAFIQDRIASLTYLNATTGLTAATYAFASEGLSLVIRPANVPPTIIAAQPSPTANSGASATGSALAPVSGAGIIGLSQMDIDWIAIGAALALLLIITLVFFLLLRRRRQQKLKDASDAIGSPGAVQPATAAASLTLKGRFFRWRGRRSPKVAPAPIVDTSNVTGVAAEAAPPADGTTVELQTRTNAASDANYSDFDEDELADLQMDVAELFARRTSAAAQPSPAQHSRHPSIVQPSPIQHSRHPSIVQPSPVLHSRHPSIVQVSPAPRHPSTVHASPLDSPAPRHPSIVQLSPAPRHPSIVQPSPAPRHPSIVQPSPAPRHLSISEPSPGPQSRRASVVESSPLAARRSSSRSQGFAWSQPVDAAEPPTTASAEDLLI